MALRISTVMAVLCWAACLATAQTAPATRAELESDPAVPSVGPPPSTQPAARDARWMTRHQLYVDRARQGQIDVVLFGDSLAEGWFDAGRATWQSRIAILRSVCFAIGGDRTEHLLWRLKRGELDGYKAKVVAVMIGTNNLKSVTVSHTVEETVLGIKAIVEEIRRKQPEAKVLILGILPRQPQRYPWIGEKIKKTNEQLAKLADRETIFFLDMGSRFADEKGNLVAELYAPDQLHLSTEGYKVWAEEMVPVLRKLLAPPSPF